MDAKSKVMLYVNQEWELNGDYADGLTIEDVPLFPGGIRVIDEDGWVLYYYDFMKNEIVEESSVGFKNRIPFYMVEGNIRPE